MQWVKCSKYFPPDWIEVVLRQISTKKVIKEEDVFCADGECFKMEEMEEGERKRIYFDDVEWLDEESLSFTYEDMKKCWNICDELHSERSGCCLPNIYFNQFMKEKYNIGL